MQDESCFNRPIFGQMFFHPRYEQREVYHRLDSNGLLLGTVFEQVDPALPTLIHFHGNGEAVADYLQTGFIARLHANIGKVNVLLVEYPGYGGISGGPKLVDMLDDGEEMLLKLQLDPARCVAYGRSIGSLFALELAARFPNLGGLFIDSGIADIRFPFLKQFYPPKSLTSDDSVRQQIDAEIDRYFHHKNKIAGFRGHLVICHTFHDSLISSMDAKLLYSWATTNMKELRLYLEGDHNNIFAHNHKDILFALKRMMAGFGPESFPLPPQSDYERVRPLDEDRTEVYSPIIPGFETPKIIGPIPWDELNLPTSSYSIKQPTQGNFLSRAINRLLS